MVRYFSTASGQARCEQTIEDTVENDDEAMECDIHHRHFDAFCEATLPGVKFPSRVKGMETLQRRRQSRLAVSRTPYLEPLGGKREDFYEQKLWA